MNTAEIATATPPADGDVSFASVPALPADVPTATGVAPAESYPHRGGLPPATLNRVRQYIEKHLEEGVSPKGLAAIGRLSAEEGQGKALVEKLSHENLSEESMLAKAVILANRAVDNGQTSVEVFRFPHALCTNNARALSQLKPGWEKTLIGVPKEIYEFWEHHLKAKGYLISFAIIDYPGGMLGDVAITLSWLTEYSDHN